MKTMMGVKMGRRLLVMLAGTIGLVGLPAVVLGVDAPPALAASCPVETSYHSWQMGGSTSAYQGVSANIGWGTPTVCDPTVSTDQSTTSAWVMLQTTGGQSIYSSGWAQVGWIEQYGFNTAPFIQFKNVNTNQTDYQTWGNYSPATYTYAIVHAPSNTGNTYQAFINGSQVYWADLNWNPVQQDVSAETNNPGDYYPGAYASHEIEWYRFQEFSNSSWHSWTPSEFNYSYNGYGIISNWTGSSYYTYDSRTE